MNTSLEQLIRESLQKTFEEKFPKKAVLPKKEEKKLVEKLVDKGKALMESVVMLPKIWALKTERLSVKTKESHYNLYKSHLEKTNQISSRLDGVNREEANSDHSAFRSLKLDEIDNKNSTVLHEMYFSNISSMGSEIHADTLGYMRLSRDWGTFDNWQFDFKASCLAAREGWGVCYLDPIKNKYMNCVIDGDSVGLPIGAMPIIVMDMHAHAYFHDYMDDKELYVHAMMKELNWDVVEARIIVAEKANLHNLFAISPPQHLDPEKLLPNQPTNQPPIGKDQVIVPKADDAKNQDDAFKKDSV